MVVRVVLKIRLPGSAVELIVGHKGKVTQR